MSEKKGVVHCHPADNMNNHVLSLSENIYFEPFKLAGLMSYLLDIIRIMCFSLWITSLFRKLRYHLKLDISDIWHHVVFSCLS